MKYRSERNAGERTGKEMSGKKKRTAGAEHVKEVLLFLLFFAAGIFISQVIFETNTVPTGSMEPTIRSGSLSVSYRLPFLLGYGKASRGDIIVFRCEETGAKLIKRVIGTEGDTVSFRDGYVYVNGTMLNESYVKEQGRSDAEQESYTVPEGMLFVMGDNREHSLDSRKLECTFIPAENVSSRFLFAVPL